MNKDNMLKWIEELETTTKEQGKGRLNSEGKFCCVGVACELFKLQKTPYSSRDINSYGVIGSTSVAPLELLEILDVTEDQIKNDWNLYRKNDGEGYTFKEIAAYLRTQLDETP